MKKRASSLLLILALLTAFSGCVGYSNEDVFPTANEKMTNFALQSNAEQSTGNGKMKNAGKATDGNVNTAYKSPSKTGEILIDLGEEKTFNSIVIREKGWNVQAFSLSKFSGLDENGYEQWETFYQQDRIEDIRYCAFEEIVASKIRLTVSRSNEPFAIREIQIFNEVKKDKDFRVSAYVLQSQLLDMLDANERNEIYPKITKEQFGVVNEIIIIGSTKYDEAGNLIFSEDAVTAERWKKVLTNLRAVAGENVKIFQTAFVGSNPDFVFGENADKTIENSVNFLNEFGYDGINFDWEFPKGKQYDMFSNYLVKLKPELEKSNKLLSCAWYSWGINLSDEALASHDRIEIMGYDTYDQSGNNNGFLGGAVQNIEYFLNKGVDPEKLSIGMSFYGRPADGSEVWVDYSGYNLGWSDNAYHDIDPSKTMYFNGCQMVSDKTAYAISKDLGGIMIFRLDEDVPFSSKTSLIGAIGKTLDQRLTRDKSTGEVSK